MTAAGPRRGARSSSLRAGCRSRRHRIELRLRDDLQRLSWIRPAQPDERGASALIPLQSEVVLLSGLEMDRRAAVQRVTVIGPVVDELLAVDPQPDAVVGVGGEDEVARRGGLDLARP